MINPKKEILKIIETLSYTRRGDDIFRDWCSMFASSIQNSCRPFHGPEWEKTEKRYTDVAKKYSQDELSKMSEMCAFLTELFERDTFRDHLGSIYMETFGGNKNLGQCFTPMSVCECMAGTAVSESVGEMEFVRMADPACGGGATLIAACGEMHSKGFDYQRRCEIEAADLDTLCVDMCFIQLSLIGARARVMHMDSLSGKCFEIYETPMMCFGAVL